MNKKMENETETGRMKGLQILPTLGYLDPEGNVLRL